LLGERVGSGKTFLNAQIFMSPELLEYSTNSFSLESSQDKILADIYSLGIIMLQSFSEKRIRPTEINEELNKFRYQFPLLSRVIEEMTDQDPNSRIFELRTGINSDNATLNFHINKAFDTAIEVDLKRKIYTTNKLLCFLDFMIMKFSPSFGKVLQKNWNTIRYLIQNREDPSFEREISDTKYLMAFFSIAQIAHIFIFSLFITLTILDYRNGTLNENFWGRIVCLSFSIVAVQYYLNLFSSIDVRKLNKKTEFWLRFNSICFTFPILYALIVDPKAWPFCSAIGVWFVAANNYYTLKLAKNSCEKFKLIFNRKIPKLLEHFIDIYSSWWIVMFMYGFGLALIGVGFQLNLLQDEWFYSLIVAFLVNGKMYFFNTGNDEKMTLVGLEYSYYLHKRANRFEKFKSAINNMANDKS